MSVQVECPECRSVLEIDESRLGARVRCGPCGCVFVAATEEPIEDDFPRRRRRQRQSHDGKATAALVLGVIGLVAWCLPIVGLPVTIIGLVLGIKGLNSRNHGLAMAGVILSAIGLMLSLANGAVGAFMGATGQHPLIRKADALVTPGAMQS